MNLRPRGSRLVAGLLTIATIATACGSSTATPTTAAPAGPTQAGATQAANTPGVSASIKAAGQDPTTFSILETTESQEIPAVLTDMATNVCKAENDALPLNISFSPSADMQNHIQLLASQGALPVMFQAAQNLIAKGGDLQKQGTILDIGQAFTDLGVPDAILPGGQSVISRNYYGTSPIIPFQYNIEGIFYNKKMFADHGITVPTTWDDLIAAAKKLKAAGIQPFTVGGKSQWPVSRWVGAYVYRSLGADAMVAVYPNKTAKLTDPGYVAAAQAIQDMGKAGLFPVGLASEDLPTAYNNIVTGKAAMMYMGTWFLANINDPKQNTVGPDGIGLMPVPAVTGGKGSLEEWPTNTGGPHSINAKYYGPKVQAWLKCIGLHFADSYMTLKGGLSGLKASHAPVGAIPTAGATPATIPPATVEVAATMASATKSILWFEGNSPSAKFTADAGAQAVQLLLGNMSAKDYMALLQADVDATP